MKKVFAFILSIVVIVSMVMSSSVSATEIWRDDHGFGTFEEGIPVLFNKNTAHQYIPSDTDGLPNGDFEQGLKYWTGIWQFSPKEAVELVEEDGNHFIRFTPNCTYDGIETIRFVDSRIKVGDTVAIMYDWRSNDPNFSLYLWQDHHGEIPFAGDDTPMHRISQGRSGTECVLVEALDDKEWNRGLTPVKSADMPKMVPIVEPINPSGKIYLSVAVQINNDVTTTADIDNIQIVHYSQDTGIVKDLNGKFLYNVNEIKTEVEDEISTDQFEDINFDDKNQELKTNTTKKETVKKDSAGSITLWVIIGVAVIVAAAVVVIIVVSKKKKVVPKEDNAEE